MVALQSRFEPRDGGVWLISSFRNICSQPVWVELSVHGGETDGHWWRTPFREPIEVGASGNTDGGGQLFAFTAEGSLATPTVPVPPTEKLFAGAKAAVRPRQPLKCSHDSKATHDLYWDMSERPWGMALLAEGRITNTCDQAIWSYIEVIALGSNGVAVGSGFSDGFLIKPQESRRVTVPTARLPMAIGRALPAYTMKVFVHVKP